MFIIELITKNKMPYLASNNIDRLTEATISLQKDKKLASLTFYTISIHKYELNESYANTFAIAILIPFANRIKNACYPKNDTEYKVELNEEKTTNTLHGLIYNKIFCILDPKTEISSFKTEQSYHIESNQLDICYILVENEIKFSTCDYRILLSTNSTQSYAQLYTPTNRKSIAIKLMTGISDSVNNKKGLQIIPPYESFDAQWNAHFFKSHNNE
jgi:aldose 1-epimerase